MTQNQKSKEKFKTTKEAATMNNTEAIELPLMLETQSRGDCSLLAPCSLILGDCMEAVKQIPSGSVDMVLMDPPYSTPTVASFGRQVCKRLSDLAIQEYYLGALKPEIERVLTTDGPLMIFCDDIYYAVLVGLFYDWKQINLLIWDKRRIGMGKPFRRRHECLFYANRGTPPIAGDMSHIPTILEHSLTKEHHGAEKPVALCEQMIRELTPQGGTVLDLFMGSGTTGVAAKKAGRHFIGCELDPGYYAAAKARIDLANPTRSATGEKGDQ